MIKRIVSSFWLMLVLLLALGASAGVATFVENDYGTATAKVAVYEAWWFELLLLLFCLNLLAIAWRVKMVRHLPRFAFHIAFVLIALGAVLTRYFGYEGVMHLRPNVPSQTYLSATNFIALTLETDQTASTHLFAYEANAWHNRFAKTVRFEGSEVALHVKRAEVQKQGLLTQAALELEVFYKDTVQRIRLEEKPYVLPTPVAFTLGNIKATLAYGAKERTLPFEVKLERFEIVYYPGGSAPATYFSDVVIEGKPYHVGMNAPLRHKGYAFYQSSYDDHGSILWVNKDPGKWTTYAGYGLLFLGLILNLFDPTSRVRTLMQKVRAYEKTLGVLLLVALSVGALPSHAQNYETLYLEEHKTHSVALADAFGRLVVQTRSGRMKPMDTISREVLQKLSGSQTFLGMSANQVVLGMLTHQRLWKNVPLIQVKDARIKEILGLEPKAKLASFEDFFRDGTYKLEVLVASAQQTRPAKRNTFEQELIRLDERLNVALMTYYGALFRFLPDPEDVRAPWLSMDGMWAKPRSRVIDDVRRDIRGMMDKTFARDYGGALEHVKQLEKFSKEYGAPYQIAKPRLDAELWLNTMAIFPKLIGWYTGLGALCLVLAFVQVARRKSFGVVNWTLFGVLGVLFVAHTVGILVRWYVGGFIPMSNTYESIVYIAWSCALAGLVLFRRSLFGLSAALLLAGIFMLVAHLGNIDPQITPLVPVLQSFWLSVHVSVITASYGFLGVGALLGAMSLLLIGLARFLHVEQKSVAYLVHVNEVALIIGLTLLVIGNFLGGIWANESWGRYWGWDPKETWTFVSILVYTLVTHWRFFGRWYSYVSFSLLSLLAFGAILMTYFGVNFYLAGLHSYATGDPVPVPVWIYWVLGGILALGALALRHQHYLQKDNHEH